MSPFDPGLSRFPFPLSKVSRIFHHGKIGGTIIGGILTVCNILISHSQDKRFSIMKTSLTKALCNPINRSDTSIAIAIRGLFSFFK